MDRRNRILWILLLTTFVGAGLWLRLRELSAAGFADDEVHKWLAANRYLQGDFGGDDVEHPMLMKWLIALAIAICPRGWAPETLTRLPNALAGGASIWLVARLGRRLFGSTAGLVAAALAAVSPAFVGYQRVAKEDTLFGAFLLLMLWLLADRRYAAAALAFAGMFASKYYFFFLPLPLLIDRRLPLRKFALIAAGAWLAVNWTPLFPSTWAYFGDHVAGRHISTPSLLYAGGLYVNEPLHFFDGVPPSFYFVFAAAKLTPLVLALAIAGLLLALRQRERVVLPWLALSFAVFTLLGAKYGRYFVSVMPALFLLAGLAIAEAHATLRRWVSVRSDSAMIPDLATFFAALSALPLALSSVAIAGEARASLDLSPHSRLYLSALVGGEANLDRLFPHCDYFDEGLREAVQHLNSFAEPGAQVSAAADLPVRFYARPDLPVSVFPSCEGRSPCYAIVQPGRVYAENREAIESLSRLEPWHVERIRGHAAATVYRLDAALLAHLR